jgi:hypothetical protein
MECTEDIAVLRDAGKKRTLDRSHWDGWTSELDSFRSETTSQGVELTCGLCTQLDGGELVRILLTFYPGSGTAPGHALCKHLLFQMTQPRFSITTVDM